ncbi:Hypothetical protein CAP_8573 [Chondromyces apiculatus DSM 436]|uniref:Uncharacterized protein n=1 Tax=Chondromyces apiculatus DSM 436 TaxID=1192034 RepID=A0A017SX27_9BACT|nr:Hypothetical protein CAP_8573 [Chondromyces apiculatus DSM 436]
MADVTHILGDTFKPRTNTSSPDVVLIERGIDWQLKFLARYDDW